MSRSAVNNRVTGSRMDPLDDQPVQQQQRQQPPTNAPAMTMRADCSAALNQASTPSLCSTGGPIAGKEPVKGAARVTAAGFSRSSLSTVSHENVDGRPAKPCRSS